MKIKALVFSGITLALSCAPFSFGQAASSDAAKPRVVITDDNLAEQLPAKTSGDDADNAAQPAAPAAAMTADEITALDAAVTEKRAKINDIQENMANIKAKAEQETDEEQKSRYQLYLDTSQASFERLTRELVEMEKKL